MKTKLFMLALLFLMIQHQAFSQAVAWELSPQSGSQATNNATLLGSGFTNCILSRGPGINAVALAGSMNSNGWYSSSSTTTLANAISGDNYYEFVIETNNCLFFNPTSIHIVIRSSAGGPGTATLRCSSDGFASDIGTVNVSTTATEFTFSETISPNSQSIIYRLYGYGNAASGTPSASGTLAIGPSLTAGDNDLELFASTTFISVNSISNITVTDGDIIPSIIFGSNVPGATFEWSRTAEVIGLGATTGTGDIPAFTALNNSGSPVTSTFTVNATKNNCTSVDQTFTITVNPPPCTITVEFFGNPGSCDDNGTPNDPSDDFFTQNIHASFFNRPLSGNLQIVPGGDEIGSYSIPVSNIIGNSHTFNAVKLKADGSPVIVQMNFTDNTGCIDAGTGPAVQPCSTPPAPCTITVSYFGNPSSCDDNGTPNDPSDDFFTQNIHASFFNRPFTGSLQIVPGGDVIGTYSISSSSIVGNSHTFNGVKLKADGNPVTVQMNFTDDPTCIDDATRSAIQPCSNGSTCDIITSEFKNVGSCNDNSTSDPSDDYFVADLLVSFSNPPSTGNLQIELPGDVIAGGGVTSVPVAGLTSPFLFTGIRFKADGTITVVEVEFSADQSCVLTSVGPNVQPCSQPCLISNVVIQNIGTCNDNGTINSADDFFTADVQVAFSNPPLSGDLRIEPPGDLVAGGGATSVSVAGLTSPHIFTGIRLKADAAITVVEVEFTANINCVRTASGPIIPPCSSTPPVITCPVNVSISCLNELPPVNPGAVLETHNCPGNLSITHLDDVVSNLVCQNQQTITRTYQATDQCGHTSSCSQTITVNDQTPPVISNLNDIILCGGNQVVNYSVPTATDNCAATVNQIAGLSPGSNFPVGTTLNIFKAIDACGNSATTSFNVIIKPTPNAFASPSSQSICSGASISLIAISNNLIGTQFNWSRDNKISVVGIPEFGSGSISGVLTNTTSLAITVTFTITPLLNGCSGTPISATVTVTPAPASAAAITGLSGVCRNQSGVVFCVQPVPGATTYNWTLPSGATAQGSANGPCITLKFSSNFNGGNLCVKAINSCGSSASICRSILYISSIPSAAGAITGPSALCPGICNTYSIAPVSKATGYLWSVSSGLSISSGQGTNSIVVCASSTFTSGSICVKANNCKGSSGTKTLNITGQAKTPQFCANSSGDNKTTGVCGGSTNSYAISGITGINVFVWTAPVNAIVYDRKGHSGNPLTVTGTDPSGKWEVDIKFPAGFISGNVTVAAQNICGNSTAASIIVKSVPAIPGTISGNSPVCKNSTKCYSIPSVPGCSGYTWSVTGGASIISGQGTPCPCVKFNGANTNSVVLSVKANNYCGSSLTVTKMIAVNLGCKTAGDDLIVSQDDNVTSLSVYPNPSSGKVTLNYSSDENNNALLTIYDIAGRLLINENLIVREGLNQKEIDLEGYDEGIYLISLQGKNKDVKVFRLVVE